MDDLRAGCVLGHLRRWLGSTATPVDDGILLERFVSQRDEDAFAALVSRHGPLVFGLCRRLLNHVQDAEDVFQATFFVLAQKAATIRKPESLSCFLHGIAYRLALKVRSESNKRRIRERQAALPANYEEIDLSWREVRGLLDEELQRLPEKQRVPLVLCYLEGLTQDEASRRLGWPRGTLKRRLEAGRERLRIRLLQRGVTLGAGLFAIALTESATKGAVSTILHSATVRAGMQFLTNQTALIASPAAVLAKGALRAMWTTKLKTASAVVVLLACAGFGASQLAQRGPKPQATAADKRANNPTAFSEKGNVADKNQEELAELRGTWISDEVTVTSFVNGEPQPPRKIKVTYLIDGNKLTRLGEDGKIEEEFTIRIDPTRKPKRMDQINPKYPTFFGIYQLEGNRLKIRFGIEKGTLPTQFSSEPRSLWAAWDLTRISRTPKKAVPRFPNAPGCYWMVEPTGAPPVSSATLGVVFIYEKDRDGAAIITLAAALPGHEPPEYRPVLLDAQDERYLPKSTAGGTSARRGDDADVITRLNRWRMDPKVLPAEKVAHIGIEAMTPESHRLTARSALERAWKEGIEVLSCPEIGKPFDFVLTTMEGKKIRSGDLRGKVVLIDCWATWCSPCRALLPELKELYQKFHKDGLEIIGVSFDQDATKLRKAFVKEGLPWPQVLVPTDEKTRQLWGEITGIGSIPRLFLIDREGVLRADTPASLKDEVVRLLKK